MTFSIKRVVERATNLLKPQFLLLFVFAICLLGITQIISNFVAMQLTPPELIFSGRIPPQNTALLALANIANAVVFGNMLYAALIFTMIKNFGGHRATPAELVNKGAENIWPLFLLSLPVIGIFMLLALGFILLTVLLMFSGFSQVSASILVGAVAIVIGVWLLLRWAVIFPVKVIEKTGVFATLSRSKYLTKGHRGPILGLYFLIFVVMTGINLLFAFIAVSQIDLNQLTTPGLFGPSPAFFIASLLFGAFFVLVSMALSVSLYLELCRLDQKVNDEELAAKLSDYYSQRPQG